MVAGVAVGAVAAGGALTSSATSQSTTEEAAASLSPTLNPLDGTALEYALDLTGLEAKAAVDAYLSDYYGAPDGWTVGQEPIGAVTHGQLVDIVDFTFDGKMTLGESAEQFAGAEDFMNLRDEVAQEYPETFASGRWLVDSEGRGFGRLGFTGEVPASLPATVGSASRPVETVAGLPTARARLYAAAVAAQEQLNTPENEVVVEYDSWRGTLTASSETGSFTKASRDLTGLGDIPLHYSERPLVSIDQSRLRGGAYLPDEFCLTSFTLRSTTGPAARMGTAAHCVELGDQTTYRLHSIDGGGQTTLNVLRTHVGQSGDLALLSHAGWNPLATFYWDPNQKKNAYARSGLLEFGDPVCHFRRQQGAQCSQVQSAAVPYTITRDDVSDQGDSGGPWYTGNTAVGVHSGELNGRSYFTAAYLYRNLGYDVLLP